MRAARHRLKPAPATENRLTPVGPLLVTRLCVVTPPGRSASTRWSSRRRPCAASIRPVTATTDNSGWGKERIRRVRAALLYRIERLVAVTTRRCTHDGGRSNLQSLILSCRPRLPGDESCRLDDTDGPYHRIRVICDSVIPMVLDSDHESWLTTQSADMIELAAAGRQTR